MSEFDSIEGSEAWRAKLAELLTAAEEASKQQDIQVRLSVNRRLTDFIANSRPNTPEILALDKIAADAGEDLMRLTIEERIASIRSRSTELTRIGKQFEGMAQAAQAAAQGIRLQKAHDAVDNLTASVRALQRLRDVLKAGTDDELAKSVDQVVGSIQKIRSAIEKQA
jgi:hypothetical protein